MRSSILGSSFAVLLTFGLPCMAAACPAHEKSSCSCSEAAGHSCSAKVSLDSIKKLAGYWETRPEGAGTPKESVIYKVTSGGSIVEEILFPGTAHEMLSVYHQDGKNLAMTHYCMIGNQPTLTATGGENSLDFEFSGGPNIDPQKDHVMRSMKLTFVAENHIRQEWTSTAHGKQAEVKVLDFFKAG